MSASMINLFPPPILEQAAAQKTGGEFFAVSCFLDISGFTPLTESLMQYGPEGAEIISHIINQIFRSTIRTTYNHGGFVATFLGDALQIIFPKKTDNACEIQALAAIKAIEDSFAENSVISTRYGAFEIAAKIGLAYGEVYWQIISSEKGSNYCYYGPAIEEAALAEKQAHRNQVVSADSFLSLIELHKPMPCTVQKSAETGFSTITNIEISSQLIQKFPLPDMANLPQSRWFPFQEKAYLPNEFRPICPIFIDFSASIIFSICIILF